MGLLDSVIGAAQQALGGDKATQGSGSPDWLKAAMGLLDQSGTDGAGGGGLAGLVQSFQQGGLAHVVQSWIGTGENLPISADQLQSVLGSEKVAQLAQQFGVDPSQAAQQLSQVLPGLINHLTPQGEVPKDGGLSSLADLATQFLGKR